MPGSSFIRHVRSPFLSQSNNRRFPSFDSFFSTFSIRIARPIRPATKRATEVAGHLHQAENRISAAAWENFPSLQPVLIIQHLSSDERGISKQLEIKREKRHKYGWNHLIENFFMTLWLYRQAENYEPQAVFILSQDDRQASKENYNYFSLIRNFFS